MFGHADDTALLHSSANWKDLYFETLIEDTTTLPAYLLTKKVKFNHDKALTASFCFNCREGKRELKVCNNKLLHFVPVSIYLGV